MSLHTSWCYILDLLCVTYLFLVLKRSLIQTKCSTTEPLCTNIKKKSFNPNQNYPIVFQTLILKRNFPTNTSISINKFSNWKNNKQMNKRDANSICKLMQFLNVERGGVVFIWTQTNKTSLIAHIFSSVSLIKTVLIVSLF